MNREKARKLLTQKLPEVLDWQDYTSKLTQLLRLPKSDMLPVEEVQMLGLIATSKSPDDHLTRIQRYLNWEETQPTEPELIELFEDDPDAAMEKWISMLQPTGLPRLERLQEEIKQGRAMGINGPAIFLDLSDSMKARFETSADEAGIGKYSDKPTNPNQNP